MQNEFTNLPTHQFTNSPIHQFTKSHLRVSLSGFSRTTSLPHVALEHLAAYDRAVHVALRVNADAFGA